jgi:hypothetical protein
MNPYLDFVQGIETGFWQAKDLSASGKAPLTESNSKVLLFSPHPDDECITGLLPLRLMRETGRQIINIPVTFGSNTQRQAAVAEGRIANHLTSSDATRAQSCYFGTLHCLLL